MSAIDELKNKLARYPGVRYTESSDAIEVCPTDKSGFSVCLRVVSTAFSVNFEGWHEHFDSKDAALDCVGFGLSEACRLCVVYRGSTPTKWIVESRQGDSWIQDSATGLLFTPFWRARRIEYRQNHLLPVSKPTGAAVGG